jgi:mannose-1-phosphate guanylyltransferase/mannose-6-phosphate isomerase
MAARRQPETLVLLAPSDHAIGDNASFAESVSLGTEAARGGSLVTFGVEPDCPHTGYGYIETDGRSGNSANSVRRFVEKPSREVAETMVQSSEYLWNAGMFVWTVPAFFSELEKNAPEFAKAFVAYREALAGGKDASAALGQSYAQAPSTSIDYALLEKSKNVMVLPGSTFGWNDLGSFISLEEVYPKSEGGVAKAGKVIALDSLANIIDAPGKTVALLGVTDMILVDAGDVILLATKERAQDVKRIVERLKADGRKDLT